jgi:excisionase family DNA binding protein
VSEKVEPLLLTAKEAAEVLRCSERQVRYMIADGSLSPVVHLGRSLRIPTATLRALVERLSVEGAARIESGGSRTTQVG